MGRLSERGVAKLLLEAGAVSFSPDDPHRGTSGILTPTYVDIRTLLSDQPARKRIGRELETLARERYPDVQTVAGTATSGIPWAAWIAAAMNVPMVYVRGRAKRHGKKAQIEGVLQAGHRVVLVDDTVNTGSSLLKAAETIRKAGGTVVGVVAVFTYQTPQAVSSFKATNLELATLTNFRTMVDVARQLGQLSEQNKELLLEWLNDPEAWSQRMESEVAED